MFEGENEDSVGAGGMILTCDQGGLGFFIHDLGRPGSFLTLVKGGLVVLLFS